MASTTAGTRPAASQPRRPRAIAVSPRAPPAPSKLDWTTRILNPKSAMEFHTPTIMMWAYGPIGSCYPVTAGVLIAKELEQAVTAKHVAGNPHHPPRAA
uniref:Uncharacterized protein n=1 Tax=Oryza rufipogon TaxID=4529 RepID=A0A0E0PV13_ORYRU